MYGLLERDLYYIIETIKKHPEIERVVIFGSRAMGNFKKGSDVDLALVGKNVDSKTVSRLKDNLNEECPLPYFFDILSYNDIANKELKEHIDNLGKIIYSKQ